MLFIEARNNVVYFRIARVLDEKAISKRFLIFCPGGEKHEGARLIDRAPDFAERGSCLL
jgi:hypothetical protein